MAAGESEIEKYFKRRVQDTGGKTRKVKFLDRNGAADRLAWWRFPVVALVELKAPKKGVDPRSLQAREIRIMQADGWPVFVINSKEGVDEFIEKMKEPLLTD